MEDMNATPPPKQPKLNDTTRAEIIMRLDRIGQAAGEDVPEPPHERLSMLTQAFSLVRNNVISVDGRPILVETALACGATLEDDDAFIVLLVLAFLQEYPIGIEKEFLYAEIERTFGRTVHEVLRAVASANDNQSWDAISATGRAGRLALIVIVAQAAARMTYLATDLRHSRAESPSDVKELVDACEASCGRLDPSDRKLPWVDKALQLVASASAEVKRLLDA